MTNLDRSVAVMLKNVVESLELISAPLKHVYFTSGLKHYGQLQSLQSKLCSAFCYKQRSRVQCKCQEKCMHGARQPDQWAKHIHLLVIG
jgi:hypothetical protein